MSAPELPPEAVLDAALEAAEKATAPGLDAAEAQRVLARVQGDIRARDRGLGWPRMAALGLATATAAAVLVVLLRPPESVSPAPESVSSAQIVFRGGDAAAMTELPPEVPLAVASQTRVDLDVPSVARVAVFGPATVTRSRRGIALGEGRAAFSVRKQRPTDPFVVDAGDAQVVVHGTQFEVRVAEGRLQSVVVREGKVEVQPRDGRPSTLLTGGMQWRASTRAAEPDGDAFDAPWWGTADDPTVPRGYVLVTSTPSGASVVLGESTIGTTPLIVLWPAGEYTARLGLDGHEDWRASVMVDHARVAQLHAALAPIAVADVARDDPPPGGPVARTDPWKVASALLDAKQCRRLDAQIARMVERTQSPAERARAEMLRAECHLRTGNKAAALERFTHVVASYADTPSAEPALIETSKLQAELGRRDESLATIETYLARHPRGKFAEVATMRRCELLVRLDARDRARSCLEAYRAEHPEGLRATQAAFLLATIARAERRFADAAPLFRLYLERAPEGENAEQAARYLIECLRLGKLEGAAEAIDDYLRRHPSGPRSEEIRRWRVSP